MTEGMGHGLEARRLARGIPDRGWGWVPACARTTGGDGFLGVFTGADLNCLRWVTGVGFLPASSRGWDLRQREDGFLPATGMGPRMREDKGRGWGRGRV